jgi:hypothetical protein
MPELPPEFVDLAANNPEGFAEAMGSGMEAMTAAIGDGASIADAFEAMGDAMGPMMEDMGISPEIFDAAGDAVGAAIGPAMHMAPADASPADMGAMMQDGLDMMTPEGVDVPAPIMDAMGDMGSAMGDAGMAAHDVGAEMMGDPGSDTYMLPVDGDGNAVVEPGQPETCPGEACQTPPMDGACASTDMMPPEGGYDHAPMNDDYVLSEPYEMAGGTGGANAGGTGGGMAGGSGQGAGGTGGGMAGGSGGLSALGGAMGGSGGEMAGGSGQGAGGTGGGIDSAISSAMDSATEQGGGNRAEEGSAASGDDQSTGDSSEDGFAAGSGGGDPSAGMA